MRPAVWLGLLLSLCVWAPVALAQSEPEPIHVAFVRDGASDILERATEAVRSELESLLERPVRATVHDGEWTLAGAAAALDAAESDPEIDVVIGLGALIARAVADAGPLTRPTVLGLAAPATAQGLDPDDDRPWANRAGLGRLAADLARLRTVAPDARRVALLVDQAEEPGLTDPAALYDDIASALGLTLVTLAVPPPPAEPFAAAPDDVDAVVLWLLLQSSDARRWDLIARANDLGLPVVASLEAGDVAHGALLTTLPERVWVLRGRHIALAVQALLEGAGAAELRAPLQLDDRFTLNLAAARALGLSPPFALLSEAAVLDPFAQSEAGTLSLGDLVDEVLTRNPGLVADTAVVRAGESQVDRARSALLPQVSVEARGTWIDTDRASGPTPPAERTLQWGATLSQSLYSAATFGEHSAERDRQVGRAATLRGQRLDLALDAALRYIDLLRASTTESIQRENLDRVRANLALAEVRAGVGSEGREEIFRWEIEQARSQEEVVRAAAARRQAEIAINELRDHPLDEPVVPGETSWDVLDLVAVDPRLDPYLEEPAAFEALRGYTTERARTTAPELQALDAQIRAARTNVTTRERRLYVPDVSLEAALTDRFAEGGAGTEGGATIPGFTIPDDWDWSLGLVARLPLITGGGRFADLETARATLAGLEARRRELELAVESAVQNRLAAASASHQTLALTRRAAEAAEANLALVRDAYERGATDLIRLVDAQAQSLVTSLARANAAFEFLQDYLALERAVGRTSVGPDAEPADAFFTELERFAARARGPATEEP